MPNQPKHHYTGSMPSTTTKRVLIIENDRKLGRSIRDGLQEEGLEVFVAFDGNKGLAMWLTKNPDIVVMNLSLPRRSGFLVLEHIRRKTEVTCPVIAITDSRGLRHRRYSELLGVSDYFCMPVHIHELVGSVAGLLKQSADEDQFQLDLQETGQWG